MKKSELAILEKAFAAELNGAVSPSRIHVFQTRSKVAKKLMDEGYLRFVETSYAGVRISGYELTHAGRLAYCSSL